MEVGPSKGYYVNELSVMEDLMNREEFAGRIDLDTLINVG